LSIGVNGKRTAAVAHAETGNDRVSTLRSGMTDAQLSAGKRDGVQCVRRVDDDQVMARRLCGSGDSISQALFRERQMAWNRSADMDDVVSVNVAQFEIGILVPDGVKSGKVQGRNREHVTAFERLQLQSPALGGRCAALVFFGALESPGLEGLCVRLAKEVLENAV